MNLEVDAAPKDADASTLSLDGVVRLDRRGKADPEAGGGSMGKPPRTRHTRPKRVLSLEREVEVPVVHTNTHIQVNPCHTPPDTFGTTRLLDLGTFKSRTSLICLSS